MIIPNFLKSNAAFSKKESKARQSILSDDIEDVKYEEVNESVNQSAPPSYDKEARMRQITDVAYEYAEKSSKDKPFLMLSIAALFDMAAEWYDEHPETGCLPLEWEQNFNRFYSDTIADIQRKYPKPMPPVIKYLILMVFLQATKWAKENPPKKQ